MKFATPSNEPLRLPPEDGRKGIIDTQPHLLPEAKRIFPAIWNSTPFLHTLTDTTGKSLHVMLTTNLEDVHDITDLDREYLALFNDTRFLLTSLYKYIIKNIPAYATSRKGHLGDNGQYPNLHEHFYLLENDTVDRISASDALTRSRRTTFTPEGLIPISRQMGEYRKEFLRENTARRLFDTIVERSEKLGRQA